MRIVIIGASLLAVKTAKHLINEGHDIIIIETNQEIIDERGKNLDCSFLKGDGSNPDILRETNPEKSDLLLAITNDDKINIVTSLIGKSLGFKKVITSIKTPEWENLCAELGISDAIVPINTVSHYLINMIKGKDIFTLRNYIRDNCFLHSFVAGPDEAGPIENLSLPEGAKVVWFYRGDECHIADPCDKLKEKDQVVIAVCREHLEELQKRWPESK
jgi:trk system potassium uptake protein